MLWLLIACSGDVVTTDDTSTVDTSDTWRFAGDVSVASAALTCTDDVWTASLRTTGWASGATLAMVDTDAEVSEAHAFAAKPTHWDPDGAWEERTLALTTADPAQPGVSTQWACDAEPTLSFQISLLDASGTILDCRIWGAAPEALEEQGCSAL